MNEQHIYHHSENDKPRLNLKVEKNTKGYNYEATVTGAYSVDEAMAIITEAMQRLEAQYGGRSE